MSLLTKVVGTRCLGRVDPQCQGFVNKTPLPAHKRHCPTCGSEVAEVRAYNKPVILAGVIIGLVVVAGSGYLVYERVQAAAAGRAQELVKAVKQRPAGETTKDIESLVQKGDYAGIVKLGEQALREGPADATLLNNVASALMKQGEVAKARGYLQRATELKPNDPYLRYNLGCVEARAGNKDDAVNHLKKACQLGLAPANFRQDPDLASLAGYPSFEDLVVNKSCQ